MPAQREWYEKDYYQVLGVAKDANDKELTRAYRKLAKQYHPDTNSGTEEKFKEISAAYDVLGDSSKRKEYDEVRAMGPMARGPGGPTQGSNFDFKAEDLGDLIGGLFNRGRGGRAGSGSGPRRGADQESELHISFEDAAKGVTASVAVTGDASCSVCGGSGAAPGTTPQVCARCGGIGTVSDNQGFFSFSQPCPACKGAGVIIERACSNCRGTGVEKRVRRVNIRIPPGVEPGQRIRIKGKGSPGRNDGPPGDLYVVVHVARHPLFGRKGRDLTLNLPITFTEATLGAIISVPTLDSAVSLKLPAGTKSGQVFRVRGRGLTGTKKGAAMGDLLVTTEIVVPTELDAKQKKMVEDLASAIPQQVRQTLGE